MADLHLQEHGSTVDLSYAEGDKFGCEAPAASLADYAGANEIMDFTRRFETDLTAEHYASGAHNTVKIARAMIEIVYDGVSAYSCSARSYIVSTTGTRTTGSACATITKPGGVGEIRVVLATAMPSATNLRVLDCSPGFWDSAGTTFYAVSAWLKTITSTTQLELRRRESSAIGTWTIADGNCCILVHGAA